MKLPFYTVLGPVFKKNHKTIRNLCGNPLFSFSPIYVLILGTLGMVLSIFDMVRIVKCGPVLPGYLCRDRLKSGTLITPEAERDCKLICLVISAEYYLFLLIGLATNNSDFLLPFLIPYSIIICLEFLMFSVRALIEGVLNFQKTGLVMSMFMIYNWLSNSPICFLPFLILYAAIISMESVIFFAKAVLEGLEYKKSWLLMSMFMVFNWLSKCPVFFIPFLFLYALIITLEAIILLIGVPLQGAELKKSSLFMSMIMVYNWTSTLCTFTRFIKSSDI